MKKLFTILFLFVSFIALSQNNGINFQGVGRNSSGAVLASTKISLRFSVIQSSEAGTVEYVESKEVTTNAQGIFSVVIGDGTQISKTGNFSDINWKINPKFLKVEMDPSGGTSFVAMGTTRLQSVPFSYYANGVNADNVDGILSASKGGTGVASISALKTALAIDQINNTSDLAKPISTATQAALDMKVSTTTFSTTVSTKANLYDLDLKANVSDVALKANTTDVALKAPIDSPTFTGTVSGITKEMVGLGSVNNTADLAKPISTATQEALDTKVSAATFSTTLATKVTTETFSTTLASKENSANKSTATDLGGSSTSDIQFPTQKAVKTYVDVQINAGGVADGGITTNKLAAGAVTDAKVASGINKAKVGLGNVDNTADLDKPLSTATILALADKPSIDVRRVAKLDESNSFSGDQQISGNLSLSNGILNLAGGTQIQSGNATSTIIQNIPAEDLIFKTSNSLDHFLKFSKNGELFIDNVVKFEIDAEDEIFKQSYEGEIELNSGDDLSLISGDDIWLTADDDIRIKGDEDIILESVYDMKLKTGIDENTLLPLNEWIFANDGSLTFPIGSSIYIDREEKYFGFKNLVDGTFVINTYDSNDTDNDDDNFNHMWEYKSNGILRFPDGTKMGNYSSIIPSIFNINSPNGIYIQSGDIESENSNYGAGIVLTSGESPGEIKILTREYDEQNEIMLSKIWSYNSQGKLTFPDGTTLAGSYSGSTDFEFKIIEDSGFKISTFQNDNNSKTLEFDIEGILTLPVVEDIPLNLNLREGAIAIAKPSGLPGWDPLNKGSNSLAYPVFYNGTDWVGLGSSVASGNSTPTSIIYVDQNTNTNYNTILANENGFKFQVYQDGVGLDTEWSYNIDGSLTFPDGTITSGNISNTNTFGFDTRATANGLSIITSGTISGTSNLWEYKTDGVLNLPGSASVGMIYNLPYNFQEGLQITTPNAFILKSEDVGKVWRFEANGNTVFPRDLGIEGNLSQVNAINAVSLSASAINATNIITNNLNVTSEIKILNENILDKFVTDNIILDPTQLSYYNTNSTFTFALSASPRTTDQFKVAMYLNGIRVNPNKYTLTSSNLTYTKTQNETAVIAQFEYIKN